jgi:hypothetical protein
MKRIVGSVLSAVDVATAARKHVAYDSIELSRISRAIYGK